MRRLLTILALVFIFGLVCSENISTDDFYYKRQKRQGTYLYYKVQDRQKRQDTYGAPSAPAIDTYGAPAAPAIDTYGPPKAPPVDTYGSPQPEPPSYEPAPASVQGEVGTQGYYYYYYPVASGATDTKTTY